MKKLKDLNQQQQLKSKFEKPVSKHLYDISTTNNHFMAVSDISELIALNLTYNQCIMKYFDRIDQILTNFKNVTENKVVYDPTKHKTHRDLIGLIDSYLLFKYYENYNQFNSARLKSLSTNGALSWLHVPYNNFYGRQFSNQQILLLKSLVLGAKITSKSNINCNLCGEKLDQFGYHALSCRFKGLMTIRHDAICDKMFSYCKMANLDVEQEKRYEQDVDGNKTRIEGRPGDIKINNYFTSTTLPDGVQHRHLYVDFTVANIYDKSYINKAAKQRAAIANDKEIHKLKKYQNRPNIMGIG